MKMTSARHRPWLLASCAIAVLVVAPVAALVWVALHGDASQWPHLLDNVLPRAIGETALLLLGVGIVATTVGTASAWLVTAYDFRGRGVLDWALLLPLAVPSYIVAYAYLDLLHPLGPVQSTLRALLGIASPRDLWFPDVRSLPGCALLLGSVLYPYVYMSVRAMFMLQAASVVEAARTLGAGRGGVFLRVALPLARPAIAVGASLALMEALNDIGGSELLGVRTLTVSVYSTWINRSDLAGAAQLALAMLAVVVALVLIERYARRHQRYAGGSQRPRRMTPRRLSGARGALALAAGSVPVLVGFAAPALHLLDQGIERLRYAGLPPSLWDATLDTLTLAGIATACALLCGLVVSATVRLVPTVAARTFERVAGLGYALPGTVLAIGLLAPIGALDGFIADRAQQWFGVATGLLLLGSGAALAYAYTVRFLTIAIGGIESGYARIPPSLDHAARTLGESHAGLLRRVHLPLLRPALAAAALLVFVDCMKELPATLLLRPLNFDTLATVLYAEAARGTYEDGALAALVIVAVGLLPVVLLARVGRAVAAAEPAWNGEAPGAA